jgi:tetratricopeptide (TPR) repeat protein
MRSISVIFLLFLISFANANESIQATFKKANGLYHKEKYLEAAQVFESIEKQGKASSDLFFNIANCYYKLGKVAPSIYYYEKALLLNPDDEAIQTNLSFAQKMAIDDIKVMPEVGFKKILKEYTRVFHYDTWAWIAVLIAFLSLLSFWLLFWKYGTVKTYFFQFISAVYSGYWYNSFFGFFAKKMEFKL